MNSLDNKVAIIAGATGGIGKTIASHFLNQGASVILVDDDHEALQIAKAELDNKMLKIYHSNLRDKEEIKSYVHFAIDSFGKIDHFLFNQFSESQKIIDRLTLVEVYERLIGERLSAIDLSFRFVIPKIQHGGKIIINYMPDERSFNEWFYSAFNYAIMELIQDLADRLFLAGVNINAVFSSPINNQHKGIPAQSSKEQLNALAHIILMLTGENSTVPSGAALRINGTKDFILL